MNAWGNLGCHGTDMLHLITKHEIKLSWDFSHNIWGIEILCIWYVLAYITEVAICVYRYLICNEVKNSEFDYLQTGHITTSGLYWGNQPTTCKEDCEHTLNYIIICIKHKQEWELL